MTNDAKDHDSLTFIDFPTSSSTSCVSLLGFPRPHFFTAKSSIWLPQMLFTLLLPSYYELSCIFQERTSGQKGPLFRERGEDNTKEGDGSPLRVAIRGGEGGGDEGRGEEVERQKRGYQFWIRPPPPPLPLQPPPTKKRRGTNYSWSSSLSPPSSSSSNPIKKEEREREGLPVPFFSFRTMSVVRVVRFGEEEEDVKVRSLL